MSILDMRVPREAADWLDAHKWVREPGDGVTTGCLHTALLRPCSTPGDNMLWHHLMRRRSYTEAWNDEPGRRKAQVLRVLRGAVEPTEAEMADMFGPQWLAIRDLVRRAAALTPDDAGALGATGDAARVAAVDAAMYAAVDAAMYAAVDAAMDAARRAPLVAAVDAAVDAAMYAARRAPLVDVVDGCAVDAARALVVRDLIGRHGFTADRYRTLTGPWATVIGPAHPDDPKDGLA